MSTAFATISNS